MDLDGQDYVVHIDNATAMAAGTRRLDMMNSGALLVARTAGVEQFNSAGQRVGAAARFAAAAPCIASAILDSESVEIAGVPFVININALAGANNLRLQLYNGTTAACVSSPTTQPGPGGLVMWPVALDYNAALQKLFVLYYPFTGATTNAQIWSYTVTATAFTTPTLVYSDTSGDIAIISATPNTGSGDIAVFSDASESFILVGTTFNSVIRLNLDKSTGLATKVPGAPLIYNSVFSRNVSSVLVVPK
jgi:hypothetical protein